MDIGKTDKVLAVKIAKRGKEKYIFRENKVNFDEYPNIYPLIQSNIRKVY